MLVLRRLLRFLTCFALSLLAFPLMAQPPASTIYLARYDEAAGTVDQVRALPTPKGYNNQPSFLKDGRLLFSAQYDDQTDIYRFDPGDLSIRRLTFSQESEYSPTQTPDGTHFSVVRVAFDGSQRLWRYPLDGGAPSLLIPEIRAVGYHLWLTPETLALFIVGEPHMLKIAQTAGGPAQYIADYPGRCLANVPGTHYFSAISDTPRGPRLFRIHRQRLEMSVIATPLEGVQDFAWTPAGALLMGSGNKLYRLHPGKDKQWQLLAEMPKVDNLKRLAVSPDGKTLAFVSAQP